MGRGAPLIACISLHEIGCHEDMGRKDRDLAVSMELGEAVPLYLPTHDGGKTWFTLRRPRRPIEGGQD